MQQLSNEIKNLYSKYIGTDGKLIIDESLPEKVKTAFKYFNENNINIFELKIDEETDDIEMEDEKPIELLEDDNSSDVSVINDNITEDTSDVSVDDLNSLFD